MTWKVRTLIAALLLGALPLTAQANNWQLTYECAYGAHDPSCGPESGPQTKFHPTLFNTQAECLTAPLPCDPILDHGGGGCDHALIGSQNRQCQCVTATCITGSLGGGGSDGPTIQLPGSDFVPGGSLLTNSQFEQIAGGFHNMGDVALLGGEYGDAFFQSRYTESFENWLGDMDRRLTAQLEEIFRSLGLNPADYPSLFSSELSDTPPTTRTFENTYLAQSYDPGAVYLQGTTPMLLRTAEQPPLVAMPPEDLRDAPANTPVTAEAISQAAQPVDQQTWGEWLKQLGADAADVLGLMAKGQNKIPPAEKFVVGKVPVVGEVVGDAMSAADAADSVVQGRPAEGAGIVVGALITKVPFFGDAVAGYTAFIAPATESVTASAQHHHNQVVNDATAYGLSPGLFGPSPEENKKAMKDNGGGWGQFIGGFFGMK